MPVLLDAALKGQAMNLFLALLSLAAIGLAGFAGFAAYVRLAPSDPARWHVDPADAPDPATPNFARIARVSQLSPDVLRARIDAVARDEGAELLAGDEHHFTYLVRTRLMRYPDFVSIRLTQTDDGSTRLSALSRSRFGRSDMGVNVARLDRWLNGF